METGRKVGAVQPEEKKVARRPPSTSPYLKWENREAGTLHRNCSDRTRSNGYKLKPGKFRLDTRKKLLSGVRGVRHRRRLPRDVVNALAAFRARLDGA